MGPFIFRQSQWLIKTLVFKKHEVGAWINSGKDALPQESKMSNAGILTHLS